MITGILPLRMVYLEKTMSDSTLRPFQTNSILSCPQEMDSMMFMMHSQIKRTINTAIAERVIPEIQNVVSSMSSSGNRDTDASLSPNSQENTERNSVFKTKITKKDSRSACDSRAPRNSSSYMVTGATDTQRQIPEFLTGRIHSHPNLERQESSHNVFLDTTLPAPEPEHPRTP